MTAGTQAPQARAVKRTVAGDCQRGALRRFGIAAGVAWTAPVVMSLYSPAGAQTVGSPGPNTTTTIAPPDLECTGGVCGALVGCTSTNPDCVCVATADGLGLCTPGSRACVDFPGVRTATIRARPARPVRPTRAAGSRCASRSRMPASARRTRPLPLRRALAASASAPDPEPSAAELQRGAASTNSSAASMHANSRDDWK